MKKNLFFTIVILLLSACSFSDDDAGCPPIYVPRETARMYQDNGYNDEFQITLVGAESYCYTEPSTNRRYASITPIFRVRRLENSSITSIDADFYVKTSVNAEDYLGTRKFIQMLNIPQGDKEVTVKGRPTINRISMPPYGNFTISLGMSMSENQQSKADKMFDINYRYLSDDEINYQNHEKIKTIYLEVNPDEEVIYSDYEKKPIVVKKNRKQNNCKN